MSEVSRRRLLRGLGLASLGVVATTRGSRTAMAASDWRDTALEYESTDGMIDAFTLSSTDIEFSFAWSNFPTGGATVDVELRARLPESADLDTFESVFTGSFDVGSESNDGTLIDGSDITLDNTSFPVDVFSQTGITESHFEVPSGETEKTTLVEFEIDFSYEGETVQSDTTCSVTVIETTSTTVIEDFESGSLSAWEGNNKSKFGISNTAYEGAHSAGVGEGNYDNAHIWNTGAEYTIQNGTAVTWKFQYTNPTTYTQSIVFPASTQSLTSDEGYYVQTRYQDSEVRFYKYKDGGVTTRKDKSVNFSSGTWYEARIIYNDTNRTMEIRNADSQEVLVSTILSDTEFTDGYVGMGTFHGKTFRVDLVQIEPIE